MKKTISILLLLMCITLMLPAAVSKTVNVTAGGLAAALTASEKYTVTDLTITGNIDARDFKTMRDNMPVLAVLDMSRVSISTYIGTEGTDDYQNSTVYAVNTIPACAFSGPGNNWGKKSLTKVVLPENITVIGNWSFEKCTGITSLNIPSTVSIIGEQAMLGLNLDTINIPFAVKTIGENAFLQNGANIVVAKDNDHYSSVDGVLLDKNMKLIIHCPVSKSGRYTMPLSVEEIGLNAFNSCTELTDVVSSSRLRIIGNCAFMACSKLKTIFFPSTLTRISSAAFSSCSNLESVNLPNSVTEVSIGAFQFCTNMKSIFIPASVKILEQGVLLSSNGFVTVDENNTNYSSLNGDLYDKAKTTIYHCPISKTGIFNLPSSVKNVDEGAFYNCKLLTSIEIPQSVNRIRANAFEYCAGLTSLNIPSSVKKLENCVLLGCSNLTTITIPESVDSIGNNALAGCFALKSIFSKRITPIDLSLVFPVFDGVDKSQCALYVPVGSVPAYRVAAQWQDFYNIVEMAPVVTDVNNITTIAGELYTHIPAAARDTLIALTIKGTIDARDFRFMRDSLPMLAVLDIENATIVAYSGSDGPNPVYLDYPANTTPACAFWVPGSASKPGIGKPSLVKVVLPDNLTEVGNFSFGCCTGLKEMNIPLSVTYFNACAFYGCTGISEIFIPSNVTEMGFNAFGEFGGYITVDKNNPNYSSFGGVLYNKDQSNLIKCPVGISGEYTIPSTVKTIGDTSFENCKKLFSIHIPTSVERIKNAAFIDCSSFLFIYAHRSIPIDLTSTPGAFLRVDTTTCILYVPYGSKKLYEIADQWKDFTHIVEMAPEVTDVNNITTIAGELYTHIPAAARDTLTTLTIKGTIDARDFKFLRDSLPELAYLDIENVDVVAYSGTEGTDPYHNLYPEDAIPNYAFFNELKQEGKTSLSKIVFPITVNSIGISAFSKCAGFRGEFTMPSTVTSICRYAFMYCTGLTSINLSSSLKIIEYDSFLGCSSLSGTLNIPPSVTTICIGAFAECVNLDTVIVPSTVILIEEMAFAGAGGFIKVDMDNMNYSDVDGVLFNKQQNIVIQCTVSNRGSYIIPSTVSEIANYSFYRCNNLTSILIPNKVTYIGDYAFNNCKGLKGTIIIPSSVKTLGELSFGSCSSLDSIIFPSSVTSVESYTFFGCSGLTSFCTYNIIPNDLSSSFLVFGNVDKTTCTLYVPYGSKKLYEIADQWKDFTHIVEMGGIDISDISITLPSGGGSDSTVISTKAVWSATSDQSWLTVAPSSGTGNDTLVFTAEPNLTDSERTATVTVKAAGVSSQVVTITQKSALVLSVSNNNLFIAKETGSSASANVISNIAWTAQSDQTWLKLTPSAGTGNKTIQFSANNANPTLTPRTAIVTISGIDAVPQLITVTQAAGDSILTVASTAVNVGYADGSSVSVPVTSNIIWEAQSDQLWLTVAPSAANGNDTLVFTAEVNPVDSIRTAIVTVSATGLPSKTIVVTQLRKPFLNVSANDVTIAKEYGSKASIEVISNIVWTASSFQAWLRVSPKSETGNQSLYFTVTSANPKITPRSANVIVNGEGVLPQQITITQAAGDTVLTVGSTAVDIGFAEGSTVSVPVTSNTTWAVQSDQIWLTVAPSAATGNGTLVFTAEANPVDSTRTAIVTVSATGVAPRTIIVTQSRKSFLDVSANTVTIANEYDSSVSVEVSSNIVWNASSDHTWLKVSPKSGSGNQSLIFTTASANTEIAPRSATVTVAGEGVSPKLITVIQAAGDTVLTVDSTTVDIGYAEGSTVSVQVISNTTWKAQSDQPWLTPNPVLFEGNTDLIFTANENPNDFTRTAKISVMAPGAETKTITITQAAKPALNLMTDTLLIAKEEGSTVTLFIISANVEWRVESEEPWLSVDPESGSLDGTLTLTATANPRVGKRSSVVSISADGVVVKRVVVIQEAGDPTLILSGNSVFVEKEEGSTATVTITSNTNWSVSTDQSWLEVSPATNTGNARLIITAKLNPTIDERKATVTVYEDGIEPRLITVTQEAGDPVISILGEDIYIAPEEGSMVTIEVVSNTSWTVSTDQPWLTFTPLAGIGNGIITLTAKENPFAIDRPAHVTITDGEAISQTIDVVQSAGNVGTSDIKMGAVSIYPNPVTNVFRINGLIGKSEIFVTDLSGKILFSKEIDGDEYITVTSLEKGIYILRITNAEGQIEKKLIKE